MYESESNNSFSSANHIPNLWVYGQLSSSEDIDYFKFTVSLPGVITARVTPPVNNQTLTGYSYYIYDPNGLLLGSGQSTINWQGIDTAQAITTFPGDYYVKIIKNYSAPSGIYTLSVTIPAAVQADTTPPVVLTFSPLDEAIGVSVESNINIIFSEAVTKGAGVIVLKTTNGVTVATYDVASSSNLSISGSTLTINPTDNLVYNTGYRVEFAAGAIKDLAGNSYAGTTSYNFSTAPALNESEVQKLYIAYFNRPADPGGLAYWKGLLANDNSVTMLQNSFSSSAEYQAIYIGQQNTMLITKLYQNLFGRVVDVNDGGVQWWAGEMVAGRHTITTIAGALSSGTTPGSADNIAIINKIAAAAAFTNALDTAAETENYVGAAAFTIASNWLAPIRDANMLATALASRDATIVAATMDTTAPIVSSFSPADGATGVAVGSSIVLTFSEAVVKGTGNIEIRTGSASGNLVESFNAASSSRLTFSGTTLSIDPTNDFASNTNYFVTFAAGTVKDAAGNSYAGISTYDFRTVFGDPLTTSVNYYESRADGGYGWYAKYDLSFNGSEFIVTTRIDLTGDPAPSSYLYVWETGIETLWNSFYFTNQSEKKFPVVFDVQFVNNGSNEHYDVQVVATTGRGNMTTWYLYQDWGRSYDDEFAAHEYGHMIGMFDEYYGGATYGGLTKTGTLMSDLSRNLPVNYLSGVEYRAELLIGGELTTTKSPSMPDYFTYAADLQSEFSGVQLIGLDLNHQT